MGFNFRYFVGLILVCRSSIPRQKTKLDVYVTLVSRCVPTPKMSLIMDVDVVWELRVGLVLISREIISWMVKI